MTSKTTVLELRNMLHGLPDDLPVEFSVISGAWLGTIGPMVAYDSAHFDRAGQTVAPDGDGAAMTIYIHEAEGMEARPFASKYEGEEDDESDPVCDGCGETYPDAGDGYEGVCGGCADIAEREDPLRDQRDGGTYQLK